MKTCITILCLNIAIWSSGCTAAQIREAEKDIHAAEICVEELSTPIDPPIPDHLKRLSFQ